MPTFDGKHSDITGKVLEAFYTVYRSLGYGFSEKVYENALAVEMQKVGLNFQQQSPIIVHYLGQVVGEFVADFLVEDKVLLELKAAQELAPEHEAQLLNYLKATRIEIGLLLNFGPKAQHIRKVFDNERKGSIVWAKPQ
jgi:GxxExxY protein